MQLAPNREFIAAMTQFEASQEQVTLDNVGAGVHAPVLAPLAAGVNTGKRMAITTIGALISTLSAVVIAQSTRPEIFREPRFGTDEHDPMPLAYDQTSHTVVLKVGQRPDRVWHFWSLAAFSLLSPETLVTLIPLLVPSKTAEAP
jgi:hypothetical protein